MTRKAAERKDAGDGSVRDDQDGPRKYGKGIRQLAREFGHHRKTIRKILAGRSRDTGGKRSRRALSYKVAGLLRKWMEDDLEGPKKQRHTARRMYTRLLEEYGFMGAESTVRRWVRECKADLGYGREEAVIPLPPEVARAWVVIDGEKKEVKLFCMQ